MKRKIRNFVFLLTIIMLTFSENVMAADTLKYEDENFTYAYVNGGMWVTSYKGDKAEVLTIPESINGYKVIGIGTGTFRDNQNIKKVVLPDAVTTIERFAFKGSSLEEIVMPSSIKYVEYMAFENTPIYDSQQNADVIYIDKVAVGTGNGKLEKLELKEGTVVIADYAFENCENLKEVVLPNGVTRIGDFAFQDCKKIKKVHMPNSVESIGARAFCQCVNLTDIELSNELISIYSSSFVYSPVYSKVLIYEIIETMIFLISTVSVLVWFSLKLKNKMKKIREVKN